MNLKIYIFFLSFTQKQLTLRKENWER